MKQVLFFILLGLSFNSFCQKNQSKIILSKGQKFIVKDTISQETDMGMGMAMKNSSTSQSNFMVLDARDKDYIATKTVTVLKISMDAMGQQASYDSDKKEDSASELGKSIHNLNVPDTFTLDKYKGLVTFSKKAALSAAEDGNPFSKIFESMGDVSENNLSESFLIIPEGIKPGGSWVDSFSTKDIKTMKKYLLQSIDKNTATIMVDGNVQANMQVDMQSMPVTMALITKSSGEIFVDTKTSLISRKNIKSDITGNLEMMGQSIPVSGKATVVSVYEY